MRNKQAIRQELPSRPPISLIIMAILFFILPIFLGPKLLIYLGPFRKSLTSANELTRHTALFELTVFRVFCYMLAAAITIVLVLWKRLLQSRFINSTMEYNPLEYDKQQNAIISFSSITIMIALVVALSYIRFKDQLFSPAIKDFIIREDGLVEWSSAIIFLMCSIVSILICFKESRRPRRNMHILFAIFFFACFGEEISWGQRIFHFGNTAIIINDQSTEFNLHNKFGYLADHLFIIGAFFYGVILPAMNSIYEFWRRLFSKFGLPIPSIGLAIGFLFISLMHDWTIYKIFPPAGYCIDTLRECLSSIAFLMLMCESASFGFMKRYESFNVLPKLKMIFVSEK